MTVDVFHHDDGGIHHHAHGEGNSGKGNDVDGPPQQGHGDEGADHRHRDRQAYHQGRPPRAQEQKKDQRGEGAAQPNILPHQGERRLDIDGLVIDEGDVELFAGEDIFVEVL